MPRRITLLPCLLGCISCGRAAVASRSCPGSPAAAPSRRGPGESWCTGLAPLSVAQLLCCCQRARRQCCAFFPPPQVPARLPSVAGCASLRHRPARSRPIAPAARVDAGWECCNKTQARRRGAAGRRRPGAAQAPGGPSPRAAGLLTGRGAASGAPAGCAFVVRATACLLGRALMGAAPPPLAHTPAPPSARSTSHHAGQGREGARQE